jgi:CHAD domain-containing protein
MPTNGGRSYRLARDEELAAGLARIAAGRAEAALDRLRQGGGEKGGEAEAVHGARKDLKKLRTVLRLLRDPLGRKRYRRANARFREAGRTLSGTRDAEVKLETLEGLSHQALPLPEEAVASWRKILDRDREAATDTVRSEALAAEAAAEIEAGLEEIRDWNLEGISWKAIAPALTRTYRRGRKAMKVAEGGTEAEFHEWRKRAKDLWYELRLLSEAWPAPLKATAEEAHRLSELLGDHHDLAVLREDLHQRRLGAAETQTLETAIDRRQGELAGEAFSLGQRLYAERPKDFERRLRRYWRAWRLSEPVVGEGAQGGAGAQRDHQ